MYPAVPTFSSFNPKAWTDFRRAFTEYVKHVGTLEKVVVTEPDENIGPITYTVDKLTTSSTGMPLLPEAVRNKHGKGNEKDSGINH